MTYLLTIRQKYMLTVCSCKAVAVPFTGVAKTSFVPHFEFSNRYPQTICG